MKMTGHSINDVRNSTMVNTQAISTLEMQMGQLANHLGERDEGKFPSQPVTNSKAFTTGNSSSRAHRQEHGHAIVTLSFGRQVDSQVIEPKAELAGKEGEGGDNKEDRDAEPSTITPLLRILLGHLYLKLHILRD